MNNNKLLIQRILLTVLIFCSPIRMAVAQDSATTNTTQKQYPQYPKVDYGSDPQRAALIKKGEYLAKAGDCIACHTADGGKPFAGGLPIETPFGTIYGPNLTPDKETGIGNWTDQQFIRALKEGIRPDGAYLFPVLPYVYYNKISDEDAIAIKAYLNAIPAVHQENIQPKMAIPFRWRFLQISWRIMFFQPYKGTFQPDPQQTEQWNRGKYLVEGLGHCAMCHSPLNFMGGEKREYHLTGGMADEFRAPNITSTRLADIPVDKVVNVFMQNKLIGGGDVQGPMLEVNHDSLSYLNRSDLEAMVVYLKTVKSKEPPKPALTGKPDMKVGVKIYNQYCEGCHSTGQDGAPKMGNKEDWASRIAMGRDELAANAIMGIGAMPARGNCANCTNQDIESAVQYMMSSSGGPGAAEAAAAAAAMTPPDLTSLAIGKQVYDGVCATCHNQGQLGAPKIGDKAVWAPLIALNMDTLFDRAIQGYKDHPPRGACEKCTDADIIAAVKYMVQQSKSTGDYRLW